MARALRPGTLGPTGTPTGTWQRGPGGLAPDDDGGGGPGPPVVAEVVLEVLLDEASLLVAHLGVGVLGGGEGEAAAREVEVDGRLSRPRLPHARPQRQLHAHVEYMPTWFGPWSSSSMRALLASTRTSRHVAVARVPSRPSYMCRPLVASLRCEEKNELAWVKNHNLSLQEHRPWGARLTADLRGDPDPCEAAEAVLLAGRGGRGGVRASDRERRRAYAEVMAVFARFGDGSRALSALALWRGEPWGTFRGRAARFVHERCAVACARAGDVDGALFVVSSCRGAISDRGRRCAVRCALRASRFEAAAAAARDAAPATPRAAFDLRRLLRSGLWRASDRADVEGLLACFDDLGFHVDGQMYARACAAAASRGDYATVVRLASDLRARSDGDAPATAAKRCLAPRDEDCHVAAAEVLALQRLGRWSAAAARLAEASRALGREAAASAGDAASAEDAFRSQAIAALRADDASAAARRDRWAVAYEVLVRCARTGEACVVPNAAAGLCAPGAEPTAPERRDARAYLDQARALGLDASCEGADVTIAPRRGAAVEPLQRAGPLQVDAQAVGPDHADAMLACHVQEKKGRSGTDRLARASAALHGAVVHQARFERDYY